MKQCGSFDLFNLAGRQTKLNRNGSRELADAHGMPGSIRIACFYRLHHDLQELLTTVFQLMVQTVDVTNRHNRDNYTDKAERAKTDPCVEPCVEPRDHDRNCTRSQVVYKNAPGIEVPHLSEGAARTQDNRGVYRCRIDQEVDRRKDEEDAQVTLDDLGGKIASPYEVGGWKLAPQRLVD